MREQTAWKEVCAKAAGFGLDTPEEPLAPRTTTSRARTSDKTLLTWLEALPEEDRMAARECPYSGHAMLAFFQFVIWGFSGSDSTESKRRKHCKLLDVSFCRIQLAARLIREQWTALRLTALLHTEVHPTADDCPSVPQDSGALTEGTNAVVEWARAAFPMSRFEPQTEITIYNLTQLDGWVLDQGARLLVGICLLSGELAWQGEDSEEGEEAVVV
eukprot:27830-Rhodomonas_salina.4